MVVSTSQGDLLGHAVTTPFQHMAYAPQGPCWHSCSCQTMQPLHQSGMAASLGSHQPSSSTVHTSARHSSTQCISTHQVLQLMRPQ
jgi:hypothetical protein